MTSNVGAETLRTAGSLGFMAQKEDSSYNSMRERLLSEVKKAFKPEFLNRIDDIIVFRPLTKEDLKQIVQLEVEGVVARLKDRGIDISLTPQALEFLIEKGYDPVYGARPLKRVIQRYIEDTLSEEIIAGRFKEGSKINIIRKDEEALAFE
jgi:ATP-dependent Clp protease ATP-binding subunit ClpC